MKIILIINVLILGANGLWKMQLSNPNPAFDPKFYEEVLDPEECQQQLDYLKKNIFLSLQFFDAGAKLPRGIFSGNLMDLGNFHQCLSIDYETEEMAIKGKYCSILMDVHDIIELPLSKYNSEKALPKDNTQMSRKNTKAKLPIKELLILQQLLKKRSSGLKEGASFHEIYNRESTREEDFPIDFTFIIRLGMCIPKACTTHQAFNSSLFDVSPDMVFTEDFCRLPNDKPWSPADTTAAVIFLIIGILTIICTGYDVICKFILRKDAKATNGYMLIFSAYTNGSRLVNFNSGPGALPCLDGIRVLATLWVILGHTTHTQMKYLNMLDLISWVRSIEALYITSAPMTVDTFFSMTGILLVYNMCGKMNGRQLIKNLPVFYLNRLLRMFPLLATVALLQASFFHRLSDGPLWKRVPLETNNCRTQWWITLLHLQNFINNSTTCLGHSWYLAIDVQLHIISPLVLFWVLGGSRRTAWTALAAGLLITLAGATIFIFNQNFLVNIIPPLERTGDMIDYMNNYYLNILTRASPFFVGLIFGYLLHIHRGKKILLSWSSVALLWSSAATIWLTIFFSTYFVTQEDWDHHFVDNILNSFMRPAWGLVIGWMVFACTHGYGGPVNWFLSLDMWRLPARLCYGVYLFHYPIMFVVGDSVISPVYFSPPRFMFMFFAYISIAFFVSYFATVLIDAPFAATCNRIFARQKSPEKQPALIEQVIITKKVNVENEVSSESTNDHNSKRIVPICTVSNVNNSTSRGNINTEKLDRIISNNNDNANKSSIVTRSSCNDSSRSLEESMR